MDEFQAHLDAHPDDWEYRLIYADWLEEQGDPFCATQRWMVANGKCSQPDGNRLWVWFNLKLGGPEAVNDLDAWIVEFLCSGTPTKQHNSTMWRDYLTRYAAERDLHNALVKAGEITCEPVNA